MRAMEGADQPPKAKEDIASEAAARKPFESIDPADVEDLPPSLESVPQIESVSSIEIVAAESVESLDSIDIASADGAETVPRVESAEDVTEGIDVQFDDGKDSIDNLLAMTGEK